MNLDNECLQFVSDNPNLLVPWYIMASYAYYVQDDPIITDALFDRMAKKILKAWDEIDHRHKEYLNEDMLQGGTYVGDYPPMVEGGVNHLRDIYGSKKLMKEVKKKPTALEGLM
jgi:NAD-dependent DNA ligase